MACEIRDECDLLVRERPNLPAIDGDRADDLFTLEHGRGEQCSDAAEFDGGDRWGIAVKVGLLCTQVSDVDRLPGAGRAGDYGSRIGKAQSRAPQFRRIRVWHRTVERNGAEGLSFADPESAVTGLAEPRRVREDGLEYGL